MPSEAPADDAPRFWSCAAASCPPWRSGRRALLWQLPLFLCEPRWSDSYYYDTVAAGVLRGEPIYRDLLLHIETPGMQLCCMPRCGPCWVGATSP